MNSKKIIQTKARRGCKLEKYFVVGMNKLMIFVPIRHQTNSIINKFSASSLLKSFYGIFHERTLLSPKVFRLDGSNRATFN